MRDLLVWVGIMGLCYVAAGDFNPLQSQEAAAAVWKLRCGGVEAIGAQGGMLHVLAVTLGLDTVESAAIFLQIWCFASVAAIFWVAFRLMIDKGFEGWQMAGSLVVMALAMRELQQMSDLGHAHLFDFGLFGLSFLMYVQGRIKAFWVLFAVLLVQSALALPLLLGVLGHQVASPLLRRQIGGMLYLFPVFGAMPLVFLMVWEHFATGDMDVLQWAIFKDPLLKAGIAWNDLQLWANPELLVPAMGVLGLIAFAIVGRRFRTLFQVDLLMPVVMSVVTVAMAAWGWLDVQWMLMMVKGMTWLTWILLVAALSEGWKWSLGLTILAFIMGFFLPLRGNVASGEELDQLKARAAAAVDFSEMVNRGGGDEVGNWVSLAGLPASQLGCNCHLLGPDRPADEVITMVRIHKPESAVLPGFEIFRDSMEAAGYERKDEFWAPVLQDEPSWVHWSRRKHGRFFSYTLPDSCIQGEVIDRVPSPSLNKYRFSSGIYFSVPDSATNAVRMGVFADQSFLESGFVRIYANDSLYARIPMLSLAGKMGEPNDGFTLQVEIPRGFRLRRSLKLENPDGKEVLLVNPELLQLRHN